MEPPKKVFILHRESSVVEFFFHAFGLAFRDYPIEDKTLSQDPVSDMVKGCSLIIIQTSDPRTGEVVRSAVANGTPIIVTGLRLKAAVDAERLGAHFLPLPVGLEPLFSKVGELLKVEPDTSWMVKTV
ncbi:MAG: hypothetical protein AAB511_03840 [Patescibacteria group bacterium]